MSAPVEPQAAMCYRKLRSGLHGGGNIRGFSFSISRGAPSMNALKAF